MNIHRTKRIRFVRLQFQKEKQIGAVTTLISRLDSTIWRCTCIFFFLKRAAPVILLTRSRSHLQTTNAAPAVPQLLCCNQIVLERTPPLLTFNFRNLLPQCRSGGVGSISMFAIAVPRSISDVTIERTSKCSPILYGTYDFVACGKLFEHIKQVCSFSEIILCEVNSNSLKRSSQWLGLSLLLKV